MTNVQRLNIPLRRYQHTTRLSRRVVSLLTFLVAFGCLGVLATGSVWYGRDTTSAAAPEGSVAVIHVNVDRFSWNRAKRALHNIPLISNRPLTIDDLEPFTFGEFSIFIDGEGTRSVAIRSSKRKLPTPILDSLGILAQDTGNGVFLLSDRPLARMDWKPPHVWFGSLHSPLSAHIGSFHFLGAAHASGAIYSSGNELKIRLPRQHLSKLPWKSIPDATIAEMSTPALPNLDVNGVSQAMDTVLSSYKTPSAAAISSQILTKIGVITLTRENDSIHFLFVSDDNNFAKDQQQKLIQTAAALETPRIQAFQLPDNSAAKEIIVDPSYSTIEETTVAGTLVSRVSANQGGYFYLANNNGTFAVTDSQSLLEFWLKGGVGTKSKPSCHANSIFTDIDALVSFSSASMHARTSNALSLLGNAYASIGVQENLLNTTVHLCY